MVASPNRGGCDRCRRPPPRAPAREAPPVPRAAEETTGAASHTPGRGAVRSLTSGHAGRAPGDRNASRGSRRPGGWRPPARRGDRGDGPSESGECIRCAPPPPESAFDFGGAGVLLPHQREQGRARVGRRGEQSRAAARAGEPGEQHATSRRVAPDAAAAARRPDELLHVRLTRRILVRIGAIGVDGPKIGPVGLGHAGVAAPTIEAIAVW